MRGVSIGSDRWLIARPPCLDVRGPWMQGGARRRGIVAAPQAPSVGAALRRGARADGRGGRAISHLDFGPRMTDVVTMDKVVALCKRRGFIFAASDIYG